MALVHDWVVWKVRIVLTFYLVATTTLWGRCIAPGCPTSSGYFNNSRSWHNLGERSSQVNPLVTIFRITSSIIPGPVDFLTYCESRVAKQHWFLYLYLSQKGFRTRNKHNNGLHPNTLWWPKVTWAHTTGIYHDWRWVCGMVDVVRYVPMTSFCTMTVGSTIHIWRNIG